MKLGLIVTAGGTGSRYSSETSKLLEKIGNLTVLEHSVLAFSSCSLISRCYITCPKDYMDVYQELLKKHTLPFECHCILGGDTRMESVKAGVLSLVSEEYVLIHDAARPNVSTDIIDRVVSAFSTHQGVIPVVPVVDTIKMVFDNEVIQTVDRTTLRAAQTPQGFDVSILKTAYTSAANRVATDESMLLEALGIPIAIVDGARENIKLTNPEDLKLLAFYMRL